MFQNKIFCWHSLIHISCYKFTSKQSVGKKIILFICTLTPFASCYEVTLASHKDLFIETFLGLLSVLICDERESRFVKGKCGNPRFVEFSELSVTFHGL